MAESPASTKRKESDATLNNGPTNEKTPSDDKESNKRAKADGAQPLRRSKRLEDAERLLIEAHQEAEQETNGLKTDLEEKDRQIEDLKNKLQAAESKREATEGELRELKQDKLNLLALSAVQGPDDSEITIQFRELCCLVENFSHECFSGSASDQPIGEGRDVQEHFQSLTGRGEYEPYLTSDHPQAKPMFIQAVIWNKLVGDLLRSPLKAFMDFPEEQIREAARVSQRIAGFMALRAHIGSTLYYITVDSHIRDEDSVYRRKLINKIINKTMALIQKYCDNGKNGVLRPRLAQIVDRAWKLASAIARSRAYWKCDTLDPRAKKLHSFKIDTDRMEPMDLWGVGYRGDRIATVDLVVTPILLKSGGSNGQGYDKSRVVTKAKAVVLQSVCHA
ncbi:hypothetical protein Daus18300_008119 [Diaporthe australafricana]|uniref:Uncharacterized protein n=1 Tax=Diaporthe australafricana TaxID=127596 RepID=A0ABR3WJU6_9PEZI